jgi:glycine dehydrogenase subunit 1
VVGLPVYSWGCAIGHALRMASRMTGRRQVIIAEIFDPERLSVVENYCEPTDMPGHIKVVRVKVDPASGLIDLADLKRKISKETAAVYFETPSYLGQFETNAAKIAELARRQGAETIVGVDPLTLGIVDPPAEFGADIVVGPSQPLGIHMNCGGGVGGFIASRDEARYVREYNGFLISLTETAKPGEFGFGLASAHQTSYGMREKGKDWTGNSVYLWAIANAVYMSLLGPEGFREPGPPHHHQCPLCGEAPGADQGRQGADRRRFLQGIRRRLLEDGKDGGADQQGLAQRGHIRRQGPVGRDPEARAIGALLRDRGP